MDGVFKPDSLKGKTPETQTLEYSFEEGVEKSVEEIRRLLSVLKRDVFVFINGSGTEVGKTSLRVALVKKLYTFGIVSLTPSMKVHDPNTRTNKVIFEEAINAIWKPDEHYRDAIRRLNPELEPKDYGDFWIGIYRPDKKFKGIEGNTLKPVADIMICNKDAKNR